MSETDEFKEWLTGGDTARVKIGTIEISHASWGSIYLANWDTDVTFNVADKADVPQTFTASRFLFEPSSVGDTTEQATGISMTAYGGVIYDAFNSMTYAQRQTPITIIPREFFDPTGTQTVNPPPVWTLHNVTCNFESVSGQLKAEPLRVHRCGLYYTAQEFPVFEYAM